MIVVIGGDDNYRNEEEEERAFVSRWARMKVRSQLKEEVMGQKTQNNSRESIETLL